MQQPSLSPDAATEGSEPLTVPAQIAGKEELLPSTFDVIGPYTSTVVWRCSSATSADAVRAVEAASAAFPEWSATKPSVRRDTLLRAAQYLEDRQEECAAIMRTEMGADEGASSGFILPLGISMIRDAAARISAIQGSVPTVDMEGQSAMVMKVPIGVVVGIVPWNAPYVFAARSIATALAAGCTTVIKSSEMTPRCYYMVGKAFAEAGLPAGCLNIISCRPQDAPELARVMIEHPAVRKLNFTGSTGVGRKLAALCGQNLKPCLMELGGKNNAIVRPDADLEKAAVQCILGAFLLSGQTCMATDRIIVHSSIADKFTAVFSAVLGNMFPARGPAPTLASATSKARIEAVIQEAREKGAMTLQGGWNEEKPTETNGADGAKKNGIYLRPVVVKGANPEMRVWQEEMFGSVVAFVTVDSDEEAIEIANSGSYGLSAAIFTEDLKTAFAIAKRLESGAVHINSMTLHDEAALPHGGVRESGFGRFNGAQGLDEFLVSKSVTWMD